MSNEKLNVTENASDTVACCRQTIEQRVRQIVNQQLQSTIPKSIEDTNIQYKTVLYDNSLATEVKIYLKTVTENNENLCRTFGIAICVPPVCDTDADIMLDYLSEQVRYTLESLLVRLIKGILANDPTAVTDMENTN